MLSLIFPLGFSYVEGWNNAKQSSSQANGSSFISRLLCCCQRLQPWVWPKDFCLGAEGWKLLLDRFPHPSRGCLTQMLAVRRPSSCQWFILSLSLASCPGPWTGGLPGGAVAHGVQQWVRVVPRGPYDTFQFYSSNSRQHKLLGTIKDLQKALPHILGHAKIYRSAATWRTEGCIAKFVKA